MDNHRHWESKEIMEPMDEETFTQEENEAWQAFAQALPTYTLDDPITTIVFESKEMDEEDDDD